MATGAEYRDERNDHNAERKEGSEQDGRDKGDHAIKVEANVTHLLRIPTRNISTSELTGQRVFIQPFAGPMMMQRAQSPLRFNELLYGGFAFSGQPPSAPHI
jgi:hypothetical protein